MSDGLQWKYTVVDQIIIEIPIHRKIVASNFTHQIPNILCDVLDETVWGVEKHWGMDTNSFEDFSVGATMCRIIASTINRTSVGLPACRNPGLVDAGM